MTILETERLVIRLLEPDDYDAWYATMSAQPTTESVWDGPPRPPERLTREVFDALVASHRSAADAEIDYFYAVFTRDGAYVGMSQLMDISRRIFHNAYVGYRIHHPHRRKGYAFESTCEVIRHAFEDLGLHRVEAAIEPANTASLELAKRLGLRHEGVSLRRLFIRDAWQDMSIWAKTVEEHPT